MSDINTETPSPDLYAQDIAFIFSSHFIHPFSFSGGRFFSSMKVPRVLGCCSLTSPDAELHGATENAFVTLNPCRVSVDDIIV